MRLDSKTHNLSAFLLGLSLMVGLGACATLGEPKQYLEGNAIKAVAVGNTAAYERGQNYYAPDGRKIHRREGGEIVQRRWWVNDDDEWCETLVADGRELCGVKWEIAGDDDYFAVGRGYRIPFKIEPGNSRGV